MYVLFVLPYRVTIVQKDAYCIGDRSIFEEHVNSITHAIGAIFLLIGSLYLLSIANNLAQTLSIVAYGSTATLTMLCSTIFHGTTNNSTRRKFWWTLDQASIYLMISGTYTPVLIMGINDPLQNLSLWLLWCGALALAIWKINFLNVTALISVVSYLSLGWGGLFIIGPQLMELPKEFIYLFIGGGSVITLGLFFWMNDHRNYFHTIWHILVLAGVALHYHAISSYIICP